MKLIMDPNRLVKEVKSGRRASADRDIPLTYPLLLIPRAVST
jgi:hypothetical protein